jgi:hypothetical protein
MTRRVATYIGATRFIEGEDRQQVTLLPEGETIDEVFSHKLGQQRTFVLKFHDCH